MNYADKTKKELLEFAKARNIKGRHELSKDQLVEALQADEDNENEVDENEVDENEVDEDNSDLGEEPELPAFDVKAVKDAKSRYPSLAKRDPQTQKVIRKGVRFNNNVPFRRKYYYLSSKLADESKWTDEYRAVFGAVPPQARAILKSMAARGVTSPDAAEVGSNIVDGAKSKGFLDTKLASDTLFAYYRKTMERAGLVHDVDHEEE